MLKRIRNIGAHTISVRDSRSMLPGSIDAGRPLPLIATTMFVGLSVLFCFVLDEDSIAARKREHVSLWGHANGGTLEILFVIGSEEHVSVKIETAPNEGAVTVATRLNNAINNSMDCGALDISSDLDGSTLAITYSQYSIALRGTETGLGIPVAPDNLTCVFDKEEKTIEMSWINPDPSGRYDTILGTQNGGFLFNLPGDSVRQAVPLRDRQSIQHHAVIACRNGGLVPFVVETQSGGGVSLF